MLCQDMDQRQELRLLNIMVSIRWHSPAQQRYVMSQAVIMALDISAYIETLSVSTRSQSNYLSIYSDLRTKLSCPWKMHIIFHKVWFCTEISWDWIRLSNLLLPFLGVVVSPPELGGNISWNIDFGGRAVPSFLALCPHPIINWNSPNHLLNLSTQIYICYSINP